MLLGGDEIGRTQRGNNNAWCQDNEISWYDWSETPSSARAARVHAAADRAAPRAPGVPAAAASCAGRRSNGSGLPDVWWFRPDGRKMTRRDWQRRRARARACSSTAARSRRPARAARTIEDDSFLLLFNAHHEDRAFTLPRRRFGAQWALELSTADPTVEAGSATLRRPHRGRGDLALDRDPEAGRVTRAPRRGSATARLELRATYRLQLTPDVRVRRRARARPLPARPRHLAPVPVSRRSRPAAGSTHGYDVVDPRRLSEELGGAQEFRRCAATARDAGMGMILDVVPNHMAADDANRVLGRPRAARAVLRHRPRDRPPPAVLRHRRPRRRPPGGSGGVRGDPRAGAGAGARRADRRRSASTTPTGWPTPPATSRGCATRGVERVWVEKILDPGERLRDWPVCGTVGYEFLNDVCALFVDPAGEEALTALWESGSGDRRSFGEVGFRGEARAGARHVLARGRAARPRAGRTAAGATPYGARIGILEPRPLRSRHCRSTGPTSTRRRGRVDRRGPPRDRPPGSSPDIARDACCSKPPRRRASSPAFSRRRRRSWPRASRTRPSTATAGCWR